VTAVFAAGCCPPLPEPRVPSASAPRNLPAPVLGRFEKPRVDELAGPPASEVKREMLTEPPVALPGPKLDEVAVPREPIAPEPVAPPEPALPPADRLPDDVVVRLLEAGRAAFVRCFKKAIDADPTEPSFKVRVHVELDASAVITLARTDAPTPALDACLVRSIRWLKFPATGRRVAVDLPLFYRGE